MRVVTLDAEGWRDVADPLPMRRSESARAIVDARGRIVVARTIAGGVAIDRLDGETWTHVPIDP